MLAIIYLCRILLNNLFFLFIFKKKENFSAKFYFTLAILCLFGVSFWVFEFGILWQLAISNEQCAIFYPIKWLHYHRCNGNAAVIFLKCLYTIIAHCYSKRQNKSSYVIPSKARNLWKILRHFVPQNDKRTFSLTFTIKPLNSVFMMKREEK